MTVLLLRLAGPMQSWGTQSRFTERDTGLEPSKSGVVGLLAAALGRSREETLDDLAALPMGVRVDREGQLARDYQTAGGAQEGGVAKSSGGRGVTVLSNRYYLADADFLVALEATTPEQEVLLRQLDQALAQPVWPLYLGRKAFVPGLPVRLPDEPPLGPGLRPGGIEDTLLSYPWPERNDPVRFVLEAPPSPTGEARSDVPVSFAIGDRRYANRYVRTKFHTRRPAP